MTKTATKAHIVEVSKRLFFAKGMRAVGVDTIVAEADIAKSTLYRYFRTKDDLLIAVIQSVHEEWMGRLLQEINRHTQPEARLIAIIDVLGVWMREERFEPVLMLNAAVAYGRTHPAIAEVLVTLDAAYFAMLNGLVTEAGIQSAEEFTRNVLVLMFGIVAQVVIHPQRTPDLEAVKRLLHMMISTYTPKKNGE